jgi:hypothetical protein
VLEIIELQGEHIGSFIFSLPNYRLPFFKYIDLLCG